MMLIDDVDVTDDVRVVMWLLLEGTVTSHSGVCPGLLKARVKARDVKCLEANMALRPEFSASAS